MSHRSRIFEAEGLFALPDREKSWQETPLATDLAGITALLSSVCQRAFEIRLRGAPPGWRITVDPEDAQRIEPLLTDSSRRFSRYLAADPSPVPAVQPLAAKVRRKVRTWVARNAGQLRLNSDLGSITRINRLTKVVASRPGRPVSRENSASVVPAEVFAVLMPAPLQFREQTPPWHHLLRALALSSENELVIGVEPVEVPPALRTLAQRSVDALFEAGDTDLNLSLFQNLSRGEGWHVSLTLLGPSQAAMAGALRADWGNAFASGDESWFEEAAGIPDSTRNLAETLSQLFCATELEKLLQAPMIEAGDLAGNDVDYALPYDLATEYMTGPAKRFGSRPLCYQAPFNSSPPAGNMIITGCIGSGKSRIAKSAVVRMLEDPEGPRIVILDPASFEYSSALASYHPRVCRILDPSHPRPSFNPMIPPPGCRLGIYCDRLAGALAILNHGATDFGGSLINLAVKATYVSALTRAFKEGRLRAQFQDETELFLNWHYLTGKAVDEAQAAPNFQEFLQNLVRLEREENERSGPALPIRERYFELEANRLAHSEFMNTLSGTEPLGCLLDRRLSIVEMQNLGEDSERACLYALVFAYLVSEYNEEVDGVRCVIFCEEAHLLAPADAARRNEGGSAPAGFYSRKLLSQLCRQRRKFGLAVGIIDQCASSLPADVLANCATRIVCQTSGGADQRVWREVMHLTQDEVAALALLHRPGRAAPWTEMLVSTPASPKARLLRYSDQINQQPNSIL